MKGEGKVWLTGREDWLPEIGEMTGRSRATGKDWKTGTSKEGVEIVVLKGKTGNEALGMN